MQWRARKYITGECKTLQKGANESALPNIYCVCVTRMSAWPACSNLRRRGGEARRAQGFNSTILLSLLLSLVYARLAGGSEKTEGLKNRSWGEGDVHIYREDGWIVKNAAAQRRVGRDDSIDLTAAGMEKAAFMLLEIGHEAHAARALAAGARLAETTPSCPAAFRSGKSWILTSDTSRSTRRACRTRSRTRTRTERRGLGPNGGSGVTDFFEGVPLMEDAVSKYAAFHDSVTSAHELRDDVQYIIYSPSFHGEGWGNCVMALAAVEALAI